MATSMTLRARARRARLTSKGIARIEGLEARRLLAVDLFRVDFRPFNADFGSTATGTALLTLNTDDPMQPTLRVEINATGLEDLSAIPGAVHLAHIHGQFRENRGQPLPEQLDGEFFRSCVCGREDATEMVKCHEAVNSLVPKEEVDGKLLVDEVARGLADTNFLDFFEGLPAYGPVVQNLGAEQVPAAPRGTTPTDAFVEGVIEGRLDPGALFPAGSEFRLDTTYTYDLHDEDQKREFFNTVGARGQVLQDRMIVLHGLTIPTDIAEAIDEAAGLSPDDLVASVPLGDGTSFAIVGLAAGGQIVPVVDDAPLTGVFRVDTDGARALQSTFSRDAAFNNEIGFVVTDERGRVDGFIPDDNGFAEVALRSETRQVLFSSGARDGDDARNVTVPDDANIVFYLIQNGSTEDLLAENPENLKGEGRLAFFSTAAANPDSDQHVLLSGEGDDLLFSFEDLTDLGDRDFNDAVFSVRVSEVARSSGIDDNSDEDDEDGNGDELTG